MITNKFIVSQLTARRQYAPARIIAEYNLLDKLFIDGYYNVEALPIFKVLDRLLPVSVCNTYKRYSPSISREYICYDWITSLKYKYSLRKASVDKLYAVHTEAYRALTKNVIEYLEHSGSSASCYYGFDTASLEFFHWAQGKGWRLFLDQCVAPRRAQIEMFEQFEEMYGLKSEDNIRHCRRFQYREEAEWELATRVLVPSLYVKSELLKCGVPESKISLVEFGYKSSVTFEVASENVQRKFSSPTAKLRILFVGNGGVRKGVFDIFRVAEKFKDANVEFRIAGRLDDIAIEHFKRSNRFNVSLLGKLTFLELEQEYKDADIFLLPSYLEGSAMAVFEAMSWGLPVLTTLQTGSVVKDGQNGFVFEAGDVVELEQLVLKLLEDDSLRFEMARNALLVATEHTLLDYSKKLIKALTT